MKLTIISLMLLLSSVARGEVERKEIEALLPYELVEVLKVQDKTKIENKFKQKIFKKEADALYLNYFGQKGDVTLGFKDDKVTYIYIKVPTEIQKKGESLFEKAYDNLTTEEKESLSDNSARDFSHQKGRYTLIDLSKKSMKLEFNNDEKRTLRSVLLWPLGSKLP